jgi:hypothetical protein
LRIATCVCCVGNQIAVVLDQLADVDRAALRQYLDLLAHPRFGVARRIWRGRDAV